MAGIVEAVLIEDQGVAQRADLQQVMPVAAVASQTGDFEPQHDAGSAQAHFADELLKPFAIGGRSARLAQVMVDHDDPFDRPTKRHGSFA